MRKIALALSLFASAVTQADVLGVTFAGTIVDINSTTGSVTTVGASGLTNINSMAASANFFYVATGGKLYQINPTTGASTLLSTMTFAGATDIRAMSIDGNGTLYVITNSSPSDELWTVNISTGAGTLVGQTGMVGIQALEFDKDNVLWGWNVDSTNQGLCRFNRMTGTAVDVNPTVGGSVQSLTFLDDGRMLAFSSTMSNVNLGTGELTQLATGLGDIRGADKRISNVPNYVLPTRTIIRLGQGNSAPLSALAEDDGVPLEVCKFIVPNQSTPPVQLEIHSVSFYSQLTLYRFIMRHRATTAGSFRATLQLKNFQSNAFQQVAQYNLNSSYSTSVFSETGSPDLYVGPNREMQAKLLVQPLGPTPVNTWCYDLDRAEWQILPFIR